MAWNWFKATSHQTPGFFLTVESAEHIDTLVEKSFSDRVILYKHSTRCSISSAAYHQVAEWMNKCQDELLPVAYVDVIRNRFESMKIAERFEIRHQSPQILVIENGQLMEHFSHFEIRVSKLASLLENPCQG